MKACRHHRDTLRFLAAVLMLLAAFSGTIIPTWHSHVVALDTGFPGKASISDPVSHHHGVTGHCDICVLLVHAGTPGCAPAQWAPSPLMSLECFPLPPLPALGIRLPHACAGRAPPSL